MENKFKINFRQQKYMLPLVTYPFVIGTLYLICDLFNTEVAEAPSKLQTTEYLNAELPEANVSSEIGDKSTNMERSYGKIRDLTAVAEVEKDTVKVENFDSKYSESEAEHIIREEAKRAREKEDRRVRDAEKANKGGKWDSLKESISKNAFDNDDILSKLSPEDRKRLEELRNSRKSRAAASSGEPVMQQANAATAQAANAETAAITPTSKNRRKEVKSLSEDERTRSVVKKTNAESDYFNTIASNAKESNLIKAIIDENIKAVEGSRVRLRLIDDIEIEGETLKKGTYMYATMSGFGEQRVKGKIESVLVDDQLIKISLSLYDLDGLEGLYVPSSTFRETAKDVAGSAAEQNMSLENNGSGSVAQWVAQTTQNTYQKVAQSLGKAIKKNKVKLKYGTQVYLINSQQQNKKKK